MTLYPDTNTIALYPRSIYVDAVLNHMAGLGRTGQGIGGSSFNSDEHDFPGVPYTVDDFNPRSKCPSTDGERG